MLVKKSNIPTKYILPVLITGTNYKTNFYYDSENNLFKAYKQYKAINGKVKPLYPIIDHVTYYGGNI